MKTKLHGLLTDLIEAWALIDELDEGPTPLCGIYSRDDLARVGEAVKVIEDYLDRKNLVDRDVWSELYAKNKVFDELAEEIRKESFEGDDK